MPFYAVARGVAPGVYTSWPECQTQITGFNGARYKKFATKEEAEEFVQENKANNPVVDRRPKNDSSSDDSSDSEPESHSEKRKHSDDDDDDDEEAGSEKKKLATDDKFSRDSEGFVTVYIGGACEFHGKRGQVAGIGVYFGPDHPKNAAEPFRGTSLSNNVADIQAATHAIELAQAAGLKKVAVHTDSQYMINCMTSWIKGWKKKNWVKGDGEPVKNKDELIALDKASEGLVLKWVNAKGQDGTKEARSLSKQGAKLYTAEEK